tara:strand:+ start:36186 stop:36836 length:651 start_codon:yes stop_codon:yes gene_type:complete
MNIKNQIISILNEIDKRAELVVVSKTRNFNEIKEAYDIGQKCFGENRVQELVDKYDKLPKDIEWHMIGHLQKNKVKYISSFITLIHSLDRLSLALEIDKNAKKNNRIIDCLIQLKISKEDTKFGLNIEELDVFIEKLRELQNINVIGLMGMATFTDDEKIVNNEFKEIKKQFDKLKFTNKNLKILSIGMSDDYLIGIKNGSNMVRIGSKIFGKRNY